MTGGMRWLPPLSSYSRGVWLGYPLPRQRNTGKTVMADKGGCDDLLLIFSSSPRLFYFTSKQLKGRLRELV
eukprot:15699442-Heterocapsa_arctica.AAC.1